MFEWQKHSQTKADVPDYQDLLDFIDLRAQASETSIPASAKKHVKNDMPPPKKTPGFGKGIASFTANAGSMSNHCVLCETERHPLYICPKFKSMSHDDKFSTLKKGQSLSKLPWQWTFHPTMQVLSQVQEVSTATPHSVACGA